MEPLPPRNQFNFTQIPIDDPVREDRRDRPRSGNRRVPTRDEFRWKLIECRFNPGRDPAEVGKQLPC